MRIPRNPRSRPAAPRALWAIAVLGGAVASCGSRTGLFSEGFGVGTVTEGPHTIGEAGADGTIMVDTGLDTLPPIDVMPKPDVDRSDCPDADSTFIYVVTEQQELFSFFPPTLSFKLVGNLVCPVSSSMVMPFSMAVDRRGVAYVLYSDGNLFRVSTATGACTATPFAVGQGGFTTFGMGFASDFGGAAERLYVSQNALDTTPTGLAFIDTNTFDLSLIGLFGVDIPRSELTGTGDGRLFAYWPTASAFGTGSHISELNKATGAVLAQTDLSFGSSHDAFAFAFWGGDFWIFTGAVGAPTDVSRFRPSDGTTTTPTTHPSTIVGAGVSTCAPSL
jgi:hypothetical protein